MRRNTEILNQYQKIKVMPTEIEGIKFHTVPEVAKVLRITPQTVRAYIREGKLKAQRIGRPIYVTDKNLREFLQPSL